MFYYVHKQRTKVYACLRWIFYLFIHTLILNYYYEEEDDNDCNDLVEEKWAMYYEWLD